MVGACIGFVGIIGVRVLVLGDSFDGLHSKFAETGMLETVGVSLLAILILLFSIFLQVLLHEGGHLVCSLAFAATETESLRSISIDPTCMSIGGNPRKSPNSGEIYGSIRSCSPG